MKLLSLQLNYPKYIRYQTKELQIYMNYSVIIDILIVVFYITLS
jgi:hypothetical protein